MWEIDGCRVSYSTCKAIISSEAKLVTREAAQLHRQAGSWPADGNQPSKNYDTANASSHLRQIILSWLNLRARSASDGSMMPPRSLSTKWRVDSAVHRLRDHWAAATASG